MDVKRFQQELAELVARHGGRLSEPAEIEIDDTPRKEHYVHPLPEMRGLHMFTAVRDVQLIRIKVFVEADAAGVWQHGINDIPMHQSFHQWKQWERNILPA
jgi:hypothetical protein